MQSSTKTPHVADFRQPLIVFFSLLAAAFLLTRIEYSWAGWRPASCMPDACFCEAIRPGTIAQPANTWSNFGFVLIGLLVFAQGRHDALHRTSGGVCNPIRDKLAFSALYGGASVLTGLGSFFYHASLTFSGQFIDVMGMYLVAVFILLYNLARLGKIGSRGFVVGYIVLNAVLAWVLIALPELRRPVFALLLVLALGVEIVARRRTQTVINTRLLQAAAGLMVLAFTIWILDLKKILCSPYSPLQGHAVWHFLSAASVGFLYAYYRSERASRAPGHPALGDVPTPAPYPAPQFPEDELGQ